MTAALPPYRYGRAAMVTKDEKAARTVDPAEPRDEEQAPRHRCMICGQPGPETICEHCKIVVQAEAVSEKRKIIKEGGGPTTPR